MQKVAERNKTEKFFTSQFISAVPINSVENENRLKKILPILNSEWKQILEAYCLDYVPQSCAQIREMFKQAVHGAIKLPDVGLFSEYMELSFSPYLAVKRIETPRFWSRKSVRWCSTKFGTEFGKPIAAFSIKWAVENKLSLKQVFGNSPLARAKLLLHLYEKRTSTESELSRFLDLDESGVRCHLKWLERINFIKYSSVNTEKSGWAKYSWIQPNDSSSISLDITHRNNTVQIIELYFGNQEAKLEYHEVAKLLKIHPKNTSAILNRLLDLGILKADSWRSRKIQSATELDSKGFEFVRSFLIPLIDSLKNGPTLYKMRQILPDTFKYVPSAAGLYAKQSNQFKINNSYLLSAKLRNFISKYWHTYKMWPRAKEVLNAVDRPERYTLLNRLVEAGELKKRISGKESRYSLVRA